MLATKTKQIRRCRLNANILNAETAAPYKPILSATSPASRTSITPRPLSSFSLDHSGHLNALDVVGVQYLGD